MVPHHHKLLQKILLNTVFHSMLTCQKIHNKKLKTEDDNKP